MNSECFVCRRCVIVIKGVDEFFNADRFWGWEVTVSEVTPHDGI